MAENIVASIGASHPAPHRDRVSLLALGFGFFGGPAAFLIQLVMNYGFASHACFPSERPHTAPISGWGGVWSLLLILNIAALLVAIAAGAVSWSSWRATREEVSGESGGLIEAGEGRTRFLSVWGILTGFGFALAVLFDLISVIGAPVCGT